MLPLLVDVVVTICYTEMFLTVGSDDDSLRHPWLCCTWNSGRQALRQGVFHSIKSVFGNMISNQTQISTDTLLFIVAPEMMESRPYGKVRFTVSDQDIAWCHRTHKNMSVDSALHTIKQCRHAASSSWALRYWFHDSITLRHRRHFFRRVTPDIYRSVLLLPTSYIIRSSPAHECIFRWVRFLQILSQFQVTALTLYG